MKYGKVEISEKHISQAQFQQSMMKEQKTGRKQPLYIFIILVSMAIITALQVMRYQNIKQDKYRNLNESERARLKYKNRQYNQDIMSTNIQNWGLKSIWKKDNDATIAQNNKQQNKLNSYGISTNNNQSPFVSNLPGPAPAPPSNEGRTIKPQLGTRAGITSQHRNKWVKLIQQKNESLSSVKSQQQKQYYQQKYNISQYEQLPFCVVIPSYNNAVSNRYINNINSILQQQYSNYHIVFIDDNSVDQTGNLMIKYANQHQISSQKLKIIINERRTMAMPNIYRAAKQFCKPYQLFVIVDGDDQLLGKQVFKFFNAIFQSKKLWLAYTNFITMRGSLGYSRPYSDYTIKQNSYRKGPFTISHLRVFYTKLLTLVSENDLKNQNGSWYRAANDVAMYSPILQMVHTKLQYIPQLTYVYNANTGFNNHKVKINEQKNNQKQIKQKQPYNQIQELFTDEQQRAKKLAMNKVIPIKNTSLPLYNDVQKYGWEL